MKRIVVKLGTNVIMRDSGELAGKVALGLLCGLVEQIAALRAQGVEVLMVSSGAVGLGVERLGLAARPTELSQVQACAAIGQSRLMALYDDAFDRLGCRIAQVLLTEDDFRDPVRYHNLRATLGSLLTLGVIPIVNENDTVSTLELDRPVSNAGRPEGEQGERWDRHSATSKAAATERMFGDNDKLSALLLEGIDADLLVLLSDVDGLYDGNPADAGATVISHIAAIDGSVLALAHGGNGRGRGGMLSKLESARIALQAGKTVVIANGRTPGVLERIVRGEAIGTRFSAPLPVGISDAKSPAPVSTQP